MLARFKSPGLRRLAALSLLAFAGSRSVWSATGATPAAPLERALASAEASLQEGELQSAESSYRSALLEGWLLLGSLRAAAGQTAESRDAFSHAAGAAVETRRALRSLALVDLQLGKAEDAVQILTGVVSRNPKDGRLRHLLAQALMAAGHSDEATQALAEARAAAPGDPEVAFLVATGYLSLGKPEAAQPLLDQLALARPGAATQVLIGRTYRDYKEYGRAKKALLAALALDPHARRAHYYLGMVAVLENEAAGLDEAIREFHEELKLSPRDPLTSLRLGMALVEAHRAPEAVPALELAAASAPRSADAFRYLGSALIAAERAAEAVTALRRALELAESEPERGSIHYQLALALRSLGNEADAATEFAAAERGSVERASNFRDRLGRYLAGDMDTQAQGATTAFGASDGLEGLASAERQELERRAVAGLGRAYTNLGVLQAQAERFSRAALLFEEAAALDPDFPQIQYSLGVARFNAGEFAEARAPLELARQASPADLQVARMLALASFNAEDYTAARDLLAGDPERPRDPALQYTYGVALVRSGRAAEAEAIFSRLLAQHKDSAELHVVLGQAHAQEGNYDAAITDLRQALQLKPDVAEASAALGVIYLKQGHLVEAEAALRTELAAHPADARSQQTLATVLDLEGRPEQALPLLRAALQARPAFADARYLLGKILLAQGQAPEALEQLTAAVHLAPEDANIHYQLAHAYETLGRSAEAEQEFAAFRAIKDKRRDSSS